MNPAIAEKPSEIKPQPANDGCLLFYFGQSEGISLPGGNPMDRYYRGQSIPVYKSYGRKICNVNADFQILAEGTAYVGGQIENPGGLFLDVFGEYLSGIQNPKILILRDNGAGDIIMSTVAVRELRKQLPNAIITYATRPRNICLLQNFDAVDNVVSIHNIRVDVVGEWDLIINWCMAIENYHRERNRGPRIDSFLKHIGLDADNNNCDKTPYFKTSELNDARARRLLKKSNKKRIAYVLQAATWNRTWPLWKVKELMEEFGRRLPDYDVVIVDSQIENGDIVGENIINLSGKTKSFMDAAAVLKCCDVVVSQDTGLAHAAGALGIPTVVIIGSMIPEYRYSYYSNVICIHPAGRVSCCPCLDHSERYPEGRLKSCNLTRDAVCLDSILPGEIVDVTARVLKG